RTGSAAWVQCLWLLVRPGTDTEVGDDRASAGNVGIAITRTASREGPPPEDSFPPYDDGSRLGASYLVLIRCGTHGGYFLSFHAIRSRRSECGRRRSIRSLQGPRGTHSLRGIGRGGSIPSFATDDPAADRQ